MKAPRAGLDQPAAATPPDPTPAPAAADLLDPAVLAEPYEFYSLLHAHAPVWHVPGTQVVLVSSFELVSEAVTRIDDFSSHMKALLYRAPDGLPATLGFGDAAMPTLATADPPVHGVHRKAVFPELVARRMGDLEGDVHALAREAVAAAVALGELELMRTVGNLVPITVVSRLIGFRDADPNALLDAAFASTSLLGGTLDLPHLETLIAQIGEIQTWISAQLTGDADGSEGRILGAVRTALDAGTLHLDEAVTILHTLLSAGGESTTSLLGNAVRILAEQPDLQEHLRQHPDDVPTFVEEVLRLESPFRYLMRSVPRDSCLGDTPIGADSTVLLFWGAANRDPAEYQRAGDIDLTRRNPRHHLAFGRGIHHCVGAPLARLEARIVINELLQRTRSIALDPADPPRWTDSLMVRRHSRLPVRLT